MRTIDLIRAAHERYLARRPHRFAVVGPGALITRHHGIEQATAVNTRRQARVVVRIEDGVETTVPRAGRVTERVVDKMLKRIERARPADDLSAEELPDAEAEGEEAAE